MVIVNVEYLGIKVQYIHPCTSIDLVPDKTHSLQLRMNVQKMYHINIVNPRRACAARVTVVAVSVCVCVCLSVCYRSSGGMVCFYTQTKV